MDKIQYYLLHTNDADICAAKFKDFLENECSEEKYTETLWEMELPSDIEEKSFNPMNNSALDNSKIKKLGYRDTFTVEEGLTHTVEILKELYCSK